MNGGSQKTGAPTFQIYSLGNLDSLLGGLWARSEMLINVFFLRRKPSDWELRGKKSCVLGCTILELSFHLTWLERQWERVVLVKLPRLLSFSYQVFICFLEQVFLHLSYALRNISRSFKFVSNFHQFHWGASPLSSLCCCAGSPCPVLKSLSCIQQIAIRIFFEFIGQKIVIRNPLRFPSLGGNVQENLGIWLLVLTLSCSKGHQSYFALTKRFCDYTKKITFTFRVVFEDY